MFRFVDTPQSYPDKRQAAERTHDFSEIYQPFAAEKAAEQAARCSQCGIPFCQVHCPLGNNIPDWLRLSAEGRLQEAYEVASATNNFPEICGRICPQDRLCEGNCVVNAGFEAITIGAVEQYLTEQAWQHGWVKPFSPEQENGASVGIIGSGPAGLAAAEQLRRAGYQVTIYERQDRAGGLMIYGIPNFKLDKAVVLRRIEQFAQSGIRFELNTEVGKDIAFETLRHRHDAVLIATGVYQPRALSVPGVSLAGVVPALDFLMQSNRRGLGERVNAPTAEGKKVVVIGGGDTAMDCVRTAIRQQAKSVTCLYRRDRENMPGSLREVGHAEEEGVVFEWLSAPRALDGEQAVTRVMAHQMQLGEPDASGRRSPQVKAGSEFERAADQVILALGFEPEPLPVLWDASQLALRAGGTVRVDAQYHTSLPGVFAAGDIVRGASLVVWAIREGREAAAAMHRYVQAQRAGVAA